MTSASGARVLLHIGAEDRDDVRDFLAAIRAPDSSGKVHHRFWRAYGLDNAVVPKSLDWETYLALLKRQLAELRLAHHEASVRITAPTSEYEWIAQRAEQAIRVLKQRPYDVVGDLDELRVDPLSAQPGPQPDDITDSDILEMGISTLFEMLSEWGPRYPT